MMSKNVSSSMLQLNYHFKVILKLSHLTHGSPRFEDRKQTERERERERERETV